MENSLYIKDKKCGFLLTRVVYLCVILPEHWIYNSAVGLFFPFSFGQSRFQTPSNTDYLFHQQTAAKYYFDLTIGNGTAAKITISRSNTRDRILSPLFLGNMRNAKQKTIIIAFLFFFEFLCNMPFNALICAPSLSK